ncbi:hypothetical protein [Mesorhizobium sp. M0408]|uniref:hypothetical protein n=1 Tax=Mesorhizobium sp. M0408 TaxID=2956942 RepID=UPI00333A8391
MAVTPAALHTFAQRRAQTPPAGGGGYRRDHLRAFAQRVEVGESLVRIMGSKGTLLRTLKWRIGRDSNLDAEVIVGHSGAF